MMRLAFRNLWRRKRRTLITATSIGFGLWLSVLMIGIQESTYQRFVHTGSQGGFGYLTVGASGFSPSRAQVSKLPPNSDLRQRLEAVPGVNQVLPRRVGEAVLQSITRNTGAAWMAVDPALETKASNLFCLHLIEGLCSAEWRRGALVGQTLAQNLKVKVGDQLIYTIQHMAGQSISLMTEVQGIFLTGSDDLDGHLFMLPLEELNAQLPPEAQRLSFYALFVDNSYEVDRLRPQLEKLIQPGEELLSWKETQPDLVSYFAANRMMYYTMLAFIGLIIASGVSTCMNMNIIERRRELGTLLALGMYPRQVLGLLMSEALCLAALGFSLGLTAVVPFFLYLHFQGFDMGPWVGDSMSLGNVAQVDLVVRCQLHWQQALVIGATPFAMSLLAALLPAFRAAYTLPLKILRES